MTEGVARRFAMQQSLDVASSKDNDSLEEFKRKLGQEERHGQGPVDACM